ncbi:MAG: homoserine kinase [Clostridiales bacterium]|jgi:homoserine kinase|nr:homoserine kinase [Clostridiales bacterium]
MVTVTVPATSANLGPGFDTLGIALGLYNRISFEETDAELEITGCPPQYANGDNLAVLAFDAALEAAGKKRKDCGKGLRIGIQADIPVSRGLGSSAAMLAAGAIAANRLYNCGLDNDSLLAICCSIEGHPDNLAPAFLGGLTAAFMKDGVPITARFTVSETLRFYALVPAFETSTAEARAVLPKTVPFGDAVFNVSRAVMLIKALETGDTELLKEACEDRLHQPWRKALLFGYDRVKQAALSSGASGFMISGSGSACLCVSAADIGQNLARGLSGAEREWKVIPLEVDRQGARVDKE